MFTISLQAKGEPTKNLQKLVTAFSVNRAILMGKISKEIAVRLQKKFRSNGGESFWKDANKNSLNQLNLEFREVKG